MHAGGEAAARVVEGFQSSLEQMQGQLSRIAFNGHFKNEKDFLRELTRAKWGGNVIPLPS